MRALIIFFCLTSLLFFQNCSSDYTVPGSQQDGTSTPEILPDGVINDPGGPEITTGLKGQTFFKKTDGVEIAIALKDPTGALYRWKINDTWVNSTEPKTVLKDSGKYDVTVEAFLNNGKVSRSRALFTISVYTLTATQLLYSPSSIPVANVDLPTVKPLGQYFAADKNRVFRILSSLVVANSLTAEELGQNYMRVNGFAYYQLVPIPGAVGADFTVINGLGVAHDTRKVFCKATEAVGADPASFKLAYPNVLNMAVDKDGVFVACARSTTYARAGFAIVKNNYFDAAATNGFFKSGLTYFRVQGSASDPTAAPAICEIPFQTVTEAGLRPYGVGNINFITDGTQYATISSCPYKKVTNVNVPTLQQIGGANSPVFRDATAIYELKAGVFTPVAGANAASFVFLGGSVYKDNSTAWNLHYADGLTPLPGVNAATLTFAGSSGRGNIYVDNVDAYVVSNSDFSRLQISSPANIKGLASAYYVYDQNRLFYIGSSLPAQLVAAVVPEALKVYSVSVIGAGTKLIDKEAVVAGARGDLMTQIDGSEFWQDGTRLFHVNIIGATLLSTSAATFRFFDAKISDEYATDGVTVWWHYDVVTSAELATFKVTSLRRAEDRLRTYSYARGTLK